MMIPTATAPQLNPHPRPEAGLEPDRLGAWAPLFLESPNSPWAGRWLKESEPVREQTSCQDGLLVDIHLKSRDCTA